jgi:hypothetical protein
MDRHLNQNRRRQKFVFVGEEVLLVAVALLEIALIKKIGK